MLGSDLAGMDPSDVRYYAAVEQVRMAMDKSEANAEIKRHIAEKLKLNCAFP